MVVTCGPLVHRWWDPPVVDQGSTAGTHLKDDAFLQKVLLLRRHHKVVRIIFVVDDVLQVDSWRTNVPGDGAPEGCPGGRFHTCVLPQVLEEPLVEDEGHAADLLHLGLGGGVPVFEVGCDGDGQLPSELLSSETFSHTPEAPLRSSAQSRADLSHLPGSVFLRPSAPTTTSNFS